MPMCTLQTIVEEVETKRCNTALTVPKEPLPSLIGRPSECEHTCTLDDGTSQSHSLAKTAA